MTNGEWLSKHSEARGIPLRTLAQVKETLALCARQNSERAMAKLMAQHGRLTDDARTYVLARIEEWT